MNELRRASDPESQGQYEELSAQVARNRVDIDALQAMAEGATGRADASEKRADAQSARMDAIEGRADVDREMIIHLQAEGLLSSEHAANLEEALRTSRTIATAMGLIMADRHVSDTDAFAILSKCSQDTNRKLRVIASEIVSRGDLSALSPAIRSNASTVS